MEITTCIICEEPYFEFHNFNCPQCKTDNIQEEYDPFYKLPPVELEERNLNEKI